MKNANLTAISRHRRSSQRGSALLIVLVMAAILAIVLYKEMPISAFEAQRQKEELLVQRGGEYKRAVKLFVRKFGRFPATIDELENTNRMRFLRHKYDDPLTGKDDWRPIHAGPGGVIMDSKVKNANAKNSSALGQGATFAGFNNSIVQADPNAEIPGVSSVAMRQRPAPTANASAVNAANNGDFPPMPSTGGNPAPLSANADPGVSFNPNQMQGQTAGSLSNGANGSTDLSAPPVTGSPGNGALSQQLNQQNQLMPQGPTNPAGQTSVNGLQNSSAFPQNTTQQGQQAMAAGGFAGVASIASGKSIKLVNDQTKYALWEFYYDLAKEQSVTMPGATQPNANGSQNGSNNTNNSTSAFGSGSSFGNNSAFGSNQNSNNQNGSSNGIGQQFPSPPTPPSSSNPPQQ